MTRYTIVALGTALFLSVGTVPARASAITLDSTNCSSADACYGLAWTLTVNAGNFLYNGATYGYQALLSITDDPTSNINTSNIVISAVDFKVSSTQTAAALYQVPNSTVLGTWTTSTGSLGSNGCGGNSGGFVCSQSSTDPANFAATAAAQTFGWYFNSGPIAANLDGAHIGAKMTSLGTSGKLLSQKVQVPEPASLSFFSGVALIGFAGSMRRRNKIQK